MMKAYQRCILLFSSLLVGTVTVWADKQYDTVLCQTIDVIIKDPTDQRFIQAPVLRSLLMEQSAPPILHTPMQAIHTKTIENSIKSHKFVKTGIVYKHWQGKVKLILYTRRPIARIVHPDNPDQSQYIDATGALLPLSENYTARVLLIAGNDLSTIEKNITHSPYGITLLKVLNYIDQDPFWRAQIHHIHLDETKKISMDMQIGKHKILLGYPEEIEKKLKKLKLFYTKVLPYKGWNTYTHINLAFDHQIVCE